MFYSAFQFFKTTPSFGGSVLVALLGDALTSDRLVVLDAAERIPAGTTENKFIFQQKYSPTRAFCGIYIEQSRVS